MNPFAWIGRFIEILIRDPEESMKHSEEDKKEEEEPVDDE